MSEDAYREFEDALADVIVDAQYNLTGRQARRERLYKARGAVDKNDRRYADAVDRALTAAGRTSL